MEKAKIMKSGTRFDKSICLLNSSSIRRTKNNSAISCLASHWSSIKKVNSDMKKNTDRNAVLSLTCLRNASYKPRGTSEKSNGQITLNMKADLMPRKTEYIVAGYSTAVFHRYGRYENLSHSPPLFGTLLHSGGRDCHQRDIEIV